MLRHGVVAVLLAATVLVAGCDDEPPASDGPVVATAAGSVVGTEAAGIESWRGIPYAAPPVGDLRWRPPQPARRWDGVRDAQSYAAACVQGRPTALSEALIKVGSTDEDCLYLNVHRPAGKTGLPVMVFIHGGSFVYGAGSQPTYNSPELVRRGVVLVTLNYRLGRLGFLAHPALEGTDGRFANFGLLDQVAALAWGRDNIEAFGGVTDTVTGFG